MPAAVRVASPQGVQEVPEFQIGVALIALRKDFPRADIKGGKEVHHSPAECTQNSWRSNHARAQRQAGVQPLQGLEAGLFIEARAPRLFPWWVQIELDNLDHLHLKTPGRWRVKK